jgi:hypothetical protein
VSHCAVAARRCQIHPPDSSLVCYPGLQASLISYNNIGLRDRYTLYNTDRPVFLDVQCTVAGVHVYNSAGGLVARLFVCKRHLFVPDEKFDHFPRSALQNRFLSFDFLADTFAWQLFFGKVSF